MTTPPLERLATLLGGVSAPGSFSAQRKAPVGDLRLEVRGVGPLTLPVPDEQARQLGAIGRPARYGRGERTLLDPRVRDTWEIPRSRVRLDKRRWDKTLVPVLDLLGRDLGIPSGCRLEAELHSMLVYGPGQFFAPHQDSERDDAMVGSLVVTLPSSFTGGVLVVRHGGETATYRSLKGSLSLVAFYADCRHEVRPVKSGHRITLTYDLHLRGEPAGAATSGVPPATVDAAAGCVDDHFTTALPPPGRSPDAAGGDPPRRLAYLLDHEYTARGLSWSRLKGDDAVRAAVLREAADRTDCDAVLALADVHETWSCFEPEWERPWYARRRYGRWDDDDDASSGEGGSAEADGYELGELVDRSVTLDYRIDPSGEQAGSLAASVGDDEVCASTPSTDLRPYASEYEGYMGNYGNTMDRWYHRGAVVLWPRRLAFAVRAEASPSWAVDQLRARARAGDVAGAREMAATLEPFWGVVARDEQRRGFLAKALAVARALDEPALAAMLLAPFRVEMLEPGHAPKLAALVDRYGEGWARELVDGWSRRPQPWAPGGRDRPTWARSLPRLAEALLAAGGTGASTARLVVEEAWRWLGGEIDHGRRLAAPSHRGRALGELARPAAAVLEAAAVIAATDLRDEALAVLCEETDDLLPCLTALSRAAAALPPARRTAAGLDAVARHGAARLEARLARPPRADDDWSVEVPPGCRCRLCDVLAEFLADPARRSLEWPLAKDGRRHVHGRIDGAELPVRHQTRRTGRPYTLVLTKTAEVIERDRQSRRHDETDLAWLRSHEGSGAGPPGRAAGRRAPRRAPPP
ncbi:MAG TPA: 2OG-Fe(II) oxygenase [Acidimicrobiales bacterium]|nr:2OG-Fe(II) oxygenase [Acidimicrobiales bacterium]